MGFWEYIRRHLSTSVMTVNHVAQLASAETLKYLRETCFVKSRGSEASTLEALCGDLEKDIRISRRKKRKVKRKTHMRLTILHLVREKVRLENLLEEARKKILSLENSAEATRRNLVAKGPLLLQSYQANEEKRVLKAKSHLCRDVKHHRNPKLYPDCDYIHSPELKSLTCEEITIPDALCRSCGLEGHLKATCPAPSDEKNKKYAHDMDEASKKQVELWRCMRICPVKGCTCDHPHSKKEVTCGMCGKKGHETGDDVCMQRDSVCKPCFEANRRADHPPCRRNNGRNGNSNGNRRWP
mmetsp:Transcript_18974/g.32661  ORF Transcript_18974/g.32661 Transcript_18974/m.32661 type:complete len:298 (+) Transcript_18974:2-895(+)